MKPILIAAVILFGAMRADCQPPRVSALLQQFDRMAAQPLWPGFEPARIPVAIYDGTNTWLVRHPSPPAEFLPVGNHPELRVFSSRHETVTANTSIQIGGVETATLILDPARPSQAAILIHECFHAFQRIAHPGWAANEASLFTYPAEDARNLALARLELAALGRALIGETACWSGQALKLRRERFALVPADAVGYERRTELNEGLAQYVGGLAAARKEIALRDFGPTEVRQRGYASGEALARVLDRLAPGWKSKIAGSLDGLLPEPAGGQCGFTVAERESAAERARADVASLAGRLADLRRAFESRPGWRLVVEAASAKPLMPQGFDPLNVERLSAREVLHKRMLELRNEAGSLEILDHESLTVAAGSHPLFNGVRTWTAAGLSAKPEIIEDGGKVRVTAPPVKVVFTGAQVEWRAQTAVIRLR